MKRLILALLICAAPISIVSLTGCKTTSAQTTAFKTISSVETAADLSYKAYLDQVVAGKVSRSGVRNVSQAYSLFQLSVRSAIKASQGNVNAPAPEAVLTAASQLTTALTIAKGSP